MDNVSYFVKKTYIIIVAVKFISLNITKINKLKIIEFILQHKYFFLMLKITN